MGEILLQFLNCLTTYISFLQTYDYLNTLYHIFNCARNNQYAMLLKDEARLLNRFCGLEQVLATAFQHKF